MARIESKVIFVTTSPRTPAKMIPEIGLLHAHFAGQRWNNETQRAFMELLREENFFNGEGANDPAFSARDRINRAPKALGFVILSPTIQLTPAGEELVKSAAMIAGNMGRVKACSLLPEYSFEDYMRLVDKTLSE